jgi:hypothetical protein
LIGAEKAQYILAGCSDALATGEFAALIAKIENATRPHGRPRVGD